MALSCSFSLLNAWSSYNDIHLWLQYCPLRSSMNQWEWWFYTLDDDSDRSIIWIHRSPHLMTSIGPRSTSIWASTTIQVVASGSLVQHESLVFLSLKLYINIWIWINDLRFGWTRRCFAWSSSINSITSRRINRRE